MYLDWNRIDHVEILEADNWLETFRVFSLKGNQMPKVCSKHDRIVAFKNPCYIFLFAVIAFVVACVRARQRIERQSSGGQTVSQPESMALRVHIHHTLSGIVAQIPFDYRRLIQCHMPIHRW